MWRVFGYESLHGIAGPHVATLFGSLACDGYYKSWPFQPHGEELWRIILPPDFFVRMAKLVGKSASQTNFSVVPITSGWTEALHCSVE